jgi:hypothetical protein
MVADSTYAGQRIREVLGRANELTHAAFGMEIAVQRPIDTEVEDRHRRWSQQNYRKIPYPTIAKVAQALCQSHNEDYIKQAVKTYRKRRATLHKKLVERIWREKQGS